MGFKVGLVDLTRGELGTRGTAEIRTVEALNAMKKMGAQFRHNLDMADGFFQDNKENQLKLIEVIRRFRPKMVLLNAVHDRHPDHGRAAKMVADACFYSGLAKISTSFDAKEQLSWRPSNVYHYVQDRNLKADFVVDISDFMEEKLNLVKTFTSQFYLPASLEYKKEMETPISGPDFLEFLTAKARSYGREAGFTFAEGFTCVRTPGIQNLFDLS
jgi:bacillithiol biosynthesis deacetylase BshB1